jgi:hypothetical protein
MPTTEDVKQAKKGTAEFGNREALIEYAQTVSQEHARSEAMRLDEHITARQALLESVQPEQRARLVEHLKTHVNIPSGEANLEVKDVHLPPPFCISYQVMRPPFTTNWWSSPSRAGAPVRLDKPCVNVFTQQPVGLTADSAEGVLSQGALSVQAAIGDFFNARCERSGTWFIGEANRAFAAIGQIADTGIALPSPGFMSVEVDLAMEGQVGWSNFLFPGEPSSGLGLVGFLGIGSLTFQTFDGNNSTLQDTYERFLLGSASAYFPGQVDRKPTFTLRQWTMLPPTAAGSTLRYAFSVSADLTAFRSTPIQNGGYPGFAHANLTVPGTPGPLQPGTPLKIKEVRTAVCLWP